MEDVLRTIAAIATAQGIGGIGIVRVSGPKALYIASKIFLPIDKSFKVIDMRGYTAKYGQIIDNGKVIDDAILLYFKAPKSYTGEDIVEFSCHGGLYLTRRVLQLTLDFGAEISEPGEFTKRAFLNGKIDLLQSEAINDLINAETSRANSLAVSQKNGEYRKKIFEIRDDLTKLVAKLTVWTDYPEESILDEKVFKEISAIKDKVSMLVKAYDVGKMIKNGINAVIVGAPNVGKSELMNYLSGFEKSIVTEFAGTTRDIVQEKIFFCGIPMFISDTAGIHETTDFIEKLGIEKAKNELSAADIVFYVFDGSRDLNDEELKFFGELNKKNLICVINKLDLPKKICENRLGKVNKVEISAKRRFGLDRLQEAVADILELQNCESQNEIVSNERHFRILKKAEGGLLEAEKAARTGIFSDVIIVMIQDVLDSFFEITGENASEAVINKVFSSFCVGK